MEKRKRKIDVVAQGLLGPGSGYSDPAVTAKDRRAGKTGVPVLATPRSPPGGRRTAVRAQGLGQTASSPAREGENPREEEAGRSCAGEELRSASRTAQCRSCAGSLGAGERSAGKSAPSGLLETRRIMFQINEIWVHTFALLLPALMLF